MQNLGGGGGANRVYYGGFENREFFLFVRPKGIKERGLKMRGARGSRVVIYFGFLHIYVGVGVKPTCWLYTWTQITHLSRLLRCSSTVKEQEILHISLICRLFRLIIV